MKRSEMVTEMLIWGQTAPEPKTEEEAIIAVLDLVEKLGMLPPCLPGKSQVKVKNRCKWEPENE